MKGESNIDFRTISFLNTLRKCTCAAIIEPLAIEAIAQLENLAVKAAGVIGCRVAGADILESSDGPVIVELNSQPGWRGLQSTTEVNIADRIVEYVLSELRS